MENNVERYVICISFFKETDELISFTTYADEFEYIGAYDIDGEEELMKLLKHFNDRWYRISIDNCGKGDFKFTAEMAINKINEKLKKLNYGIEHR